MQVRYYYQSDCYNLNRNARLFCPLSHRIRNIMEKILNFVLPVNRSFPAKLPKYEPFAEEHKEVVQKISKKIGQLQQQIDWRQDIHNASYVVFDTETTGLQPLQGDRVISLGAVVIEGGEVREELYFEELVDPQRYIPQAATEITGINDTLVAGKPTFLQVLERFLDFIGERTLVAHCAAFDLAFINMELCRFTPLRIVNPVIDTHFLAKSLLPQLPKYSLESLACKYNLEIKDRHTSLGDSLATAQIFLRLLEVLKRKGINSLEELLMFTYFQKINSDSLEHVGKTF